MRDAASDRQGIRPQRGFFGKGHPAPRATRPGEAAAESGAPFGAERGKYVEMDFIPADGPTRLSGIGYAVGLDNFRHIRAASM